MATDVFGNVIDENKVRLFVKNMTRDQVVTELEYWGFEIDNDEESSDYDLTHDLKELMIERVIDGSHYLEMGA